LAQASSLIYLLAGASLLMVSLRAVIPPGTWVAMTLLLHATRSMPLASGLAPTWLVLFVALAVTNQGIIPAPGPIYVAIVALNATAATIPFALDRIATARAGSAAAILIFPLAWVAMEFLRSRLPQQATWGSLAYSQYGFLPLMQVAAWLGIWGISFAIAWFASTFEMAWSLGFEWSIVRAPVMACAAGIGGIVLAGAVRVALAPTDRASVRAATLHRPVDLFAPGEITHITEGRVAPADRERLGGKLTRLHEWFLEESRREGRAGARLVVWPEGNLLVFQHDEASFLERARRLAADAQLYLAMGLATIHPGETLPFENKLVLIDPTGHLVASYRKSHAVPGWEAGIMRPGDGRLPVIETPLGRIASAICYDADFPEFVRQAGRGAADLLIVPANDWRQVKTLHLQMHAFRAIENGVPLVRAASSGLSAAADPWGRVLAMADDFAPGDRTMTAQVPIGRVPTLYVTIGDLFAWACVAALVLALVAPR
jgi:apolipoprotein N-acyltransferase